MTAHSVMILIISSARVRRQKISHPRPDRITAISHPGMPRDFSDTRLLDRLVVTPGRKVRLAKDFATSWKEGRAFDKQQAAERLREGVQLSFLALQPCGCDGVGRKDIAGYHF